MKVDVVTSLEIERPRRAVAAFASDPDNTPAWYVNIRSIEWETEPPMTVGSRMRFVAHFLGRRLAYTYEVVSHVPDEILVMRTHEGPFPMQTEYQWGDTPTGGTRMTLRNTGMPAGFARITAPLMVAAMKRANRKDLELLKRILESGRSGNG